MTKKEQNIIAPRTADGELFEFEMRVYYLDKKFNQLVGEIKELLIVKDCTFEQVEEYWRLFHPQIDELSTSTLYANKKNLIRDELKRLRNAQSEANNKLNKAIEYLNDILQD